MNSHEKGRILYMAHGPNDIMFISNVLTLLKQNMFGTCEIPGPIIRLNYLNILNLDYLNILKQLLVCYTTLLLKHKGFWYRSFNF